MSRIWKRSKRQMITARTSQTFACVCGADMTDVVWRLTLQPALPEGYDITVTCPDGHTCSYYPGDVIPAWKVVT